MTIEEEFKLPEIYFSKTTAENYENSPAMRKIQTQITKRALEFIDKKTGKALDVGCGTGFSMQVLKDAGFDAQGIDISKDMVKIAISKGFNATYGSFMELPFDDKSFDIIISISALQWVQAKTEKELLQNYTKILTEMYRVLVSGGDAILQFYPKNEIDFDTFLKALKSTKFKAYTATDFPNNPKKRKVFVILSK